MENQKISCEKDCICKYGLGYVHTRKFSDVFTLKAEAIYERSVVCNVRFKVLSVVGIKCMVFEVIMPCNFKKAQCFEGLKNRSSKKPAEASG
jgi:hypothetical protein